MIPPFCALLRSRDMHNIKVRTRSWLLSLKIFSTTLQCVSGRQNSEPSIFSTAWLVCGGLYRSNIICREQSVKCSRKCWFASYLRTYCPSCHIQLGQQLILSISDGLEPVSARFHMAVASALTVRRHVILGHPRFLHPSGFMRLLLMGWSLDLCVICGLSISSI